MKYYPLNQEIAVKKFGRFASVTLVLLVLIVATSLVVYSGLPAGLLEWGAESFLAAVAVSTLIVLGELVIIGVAFLIAYILLGTWVMGRG
ncbi:MAG: hypothetical protein AAB562_03330 [Patescibacteria group bacterium]